MNLKKMLQFEAGDTKALKEDFANTDRDLKIAAVSRKTLPILLKEKMIEELSAIASYDKFLLQLYEAGEEFDDVAEKVKEVRKDEIAHCTIYEELLKRYSPSFVKGREFGKKEFKGEES